MSSPPLKASDVFTPNSFPYHTYVARKGDQNERALRNALEIKNAVISVSGPSKSGKTVLVEKIIGTDNIIPIAGSQVESGAQLWDSILNWIGVPNSEQRTDTDSHKQNVGGEIKGGGSIPGLFEVGGAGKYSEESADSKAVATTTTRRGLEQVAREIASSDYTIFIDDFHYIEESQRADIARHIKSGAERGIRFCVASVPHRKDDVVRANPELRGRTHNVDIAYWSEADLAEIARVGFDQLNLVVSDELIRRIAKESCGSPQLTQAICLQYCFLADFYKAAPSKTARTISDEDFRQVLENTSSQTDFSRLVDNMHQGTKIRGVERKSFDFLDGSSGDVYRAVLLALAADPPRMDINYAELMRRVREVCADEAPQSQSVRTACFYINKFAEDTITASQVMEWDDTTDNEILSIIDPYFLFYLRSSSKLRDLGATTETAS
jgi:hypothetical protein